MPQQYVRLLINIASFNLRGEAKPRSDVLWRQAYARGKGRAWIGGKYGKERVPPKSALERRWAVAIVISLALGTVSQRGTRSI